MAHHGASQEKERRKAILGGIPAMFTFVLILGSILGGICTTTEAAVIAVWYSILLGIIYKKVTFKSLWDTAKNTVRGCAHCSLS